MQKQISQEQFNQYRDQLSAAECVTKEIPLAKLTLDEKSLSNKTVKIDGVTVGVGGGFFRSLANMVKMSAGLTTEMLKNEDGKMATALISALKDYRSARGSGNVLLVANANTREVIDICDPAKFRRLSNDSVFDVTSKILNDRPNLTIETINFDPHTGTSSINLLNNDEVGFPGAGKDEFFKFGFSIVQTRRDTIVEMYNQRLVCSNGMRMNLGQGAIGGNSNIQFEERFRLGGNKADDVRDFLQKIENMNKAGFVPGAFKEVLTNATTTRASLAEVEEAMLHSQRLVTEDDPNLKKNYIDAVARNYFHAHGDTIARVARAGKNPLALNDKQKSFIKTGMSVWDVVNSMTYLGSNNSGIPLSNQYELKADAGKLFGKGTKDGYDLQFAQFATL
jgi:hypothetical protein